MDINLLQELEMRAAIQLYNELGMTSRQARDFFEASGGPDYINPNIADPIDRAGASDALRALADAISPESTE